jgi:hypothetical protein
VARASSKRTSGTSTANWVSCPEGASSMAANINTQLSFQQHPDYYKSKNCSFAAS